MVTRGVKKTRTVGNRAHKNTDKIGFTVLTFSECFRVPMCVEYVNLCMCPCACASIYVSIEVSVPACLYWRVSYRQNESTEKRNKTKTRGVELMEEGTYFPATSWKSKTTSALHYTLLLTTGRARSLRGTAERASECMRQIIFIWDPGGYWQTGGAFR